MLDTWCNHSSNYYLQRCRSTSSSVYRLFMDFHQVIRYSETCWSNQLTHSQLLPNCSPLCQAYLKLNLLTPDPCCVSPGLAHLSDGSWSVNADGKLCVCFHIWAGEWCSSMPLRCVFYPHQYCNGGHLWWNCLCMDCLRMMYCNFSPTRESICVKMLT